MSKANWTHEQEAIIKIVVFSSLAGARKSSLVERIVAES